MVSPRTRLVCSFLAAASCCFGQNGSIQGTLTDAAGATVPNAQISATDEAKKLVVRETTSDRDGTFYLRPLLPGTYTIKAESPGFKTLEQTQVTLDQNQILSLGTLSLSVGAVSESVTVAAEVPMVETDTSQKAFTITARQVTQLPLNGRDFQSLMRTLPGVVSNDRSDFRLAFNNTDAFNVNGLRGSMNNVFLDGAINTDVGANDGQYTQVSLDAVGEFRVQTSTFNAEYGRNPGVVISINTKSGSTAFHGTLYEFFRNNALDARLPFDTTGKVAKLQFNQFGGNLGGPIIIPKFSSGDNKKLFFFFNYEGTRAVRPIGGNFVDIAHGDLLAGDLSRLYRPGFINDASGQPTAYRNGQVFRPGTIVRDSGGRVIGGDPYAGNIIPRSEWSQNAPAFLRVLNAVDRTGASPVSGSPELIRFNYQQQYRFIKNAKVARIDYNISPKANFFWRWADDSQREEQSLGIFATTPYPVFPQYRKKPGSSWSWNLINVISPVLTNEAIFAYNHLTQVVDVIDGTDTAIYDKDKLGFKYQELYEGVNLRNRFPRFSCGVGSCGFNSAFPAGWLSEGKTYAFTDNLTWNRGAHTIKTGFFWNRNDNGQQPSWTDALNVNFGPNTENQRDSGNQFANMLLGNYTSISQSNGRFFGDFRFFGTEAYIQDSWKASKKLTIEFGVRWAYMGPTYTHGTFLQNYFDPRRYDLSQAVQIDTRPGLRNGSIVPGIGNPFNGMIEEGASGGLPLGGMDHKWNNWGPRFGFAYDPFGDGKTSIRGGGGLFFERIRQNVNNFDGLGNPPLSYTPTLYGGNIDNVSPALLSGGTRFPVGVTAFDSKGQVPAIYSWQFSVQRELGGRTSVDVGYIGNMGRHLQYRRDLNNLPLGTTVNSNILTLANGTQNAIRPFKGYTSINWTEFGAISNYNALQARVSRRFATNLTANVNYTWSKAMGEVNGDGDIIGYFLDRKREYGPLGFDRTHIVTIDYVYDLPKLQNSNGFVKSVLNGWQLAGISRFWGGNPATITSNGNPGTLGGGPRADWNGGQIIPDNQDRNFYFNPLAFSRPAEGTLGNLGKNTLRLPGINQWDISVYKNTKISERVTSQLRIETFNTLNHTQWSGVNTGISAPNPGQAITDATRGTAGQVNSTRDPRNIQIALKLLF